ncbi:MAG: DEAD/DEAH box helicase [Candidatus Helarchaeota archaeon]
MLVRVDETDQIIKIHPFDVKEALEIRKLGGVWQSSLGYFILPISSLQRIKSLNYPKVIKQEGLPYNIKFKTQPYTHQIEGLKRVLSSNFFALFWEVGTGKTKVILDCISYLKERDEIKYALVMCPVSVIKTWEDEIRKHSDLSYAVLYGTKSQRLKNLKLERDIYIINYDGLRVIEDALLEKKFDLIVADESHHIKNIFAKRTRAALRLSKNAKYRYILTGTPVLNDLLEIFPQILFLDHGLTFGRSYVAFRNRYFEPIQFTNFTKWVISKHNANLIFQKLLPISSRVLKKDCLDLPEKIYLTRYIPMSKEQEKLYSEISEKILVEIEEIEKEKDKKYVLKIRNALTKLTKLSQITSGFLYTENGVYRLNPNPKLNDLIELLKELSGKIVIWCVFQEEIKIIEEALSNLGYTVYSISGSTSLNTRKEILDQMNKSNDQDILIAQIKTLSQGMNLQFINNAIFYSNSFSFGAREQAEGRIHRIGSSKVTYIDLVIPNSIDISILKSLQRKRDLAEFVSGDTLKTSLEKMMRGELR